MPGDQVQARRGGPLRVLSGPGKPANEATTDIRYPEGVLDGAVAARR